MRNGTCPKCNSNTVYRKTNGVLYEHSPYVDTGGWAISATKCVSYICATCGYFENYLIDPSVINNVSKSWEKIEPGNVPPNFLITAQ